MFSILAIILTMARERDEFTVKELMQRFGLEHQGAYFYEVLNALNALNAWADQFCWYGWSQPGECRNGMSIEERLIEVLQQRDAARAQSGAEGRA